MKRLIVLLSLCTCLLVCILLASCGNSCKEHSWTQYTLKTEDEKNGHYLMCEKCFELGEKEPHEFEMDDSTKLNTCTKCHYQEYHDYSLIPNEDGLTHSFICKDCDQTYTESHTFEQAYTSNTEPTYHRYNDTCTTCGFNVVVAEDHVSASGKWEVSSTAHWKKCDACGGKLEYQLHNLVDGACTICSYKATELPVTPDLQFALSEDESYYIVTGMATDHLEYGAFFDLVIPATYEEKPVKAIGTSAFNNFYSNANIVSVYIPDGVTEIGAYAFTYNPNMVDVRLPGSLETIGHEAFENCNIVNLVIPGKATVCHSAFAYNSSLKSLVIEEGVRDIDYVAFSGCNMLQTISLPSTIASIGYDAFENCDSIDSIVIGEGKENGTYMIIDNCLISKADMMLLRSNSKAVIPSTVKILSRYALSGDGMYYGYYGEEMVAYTIVLPTSIEAIENAALSYTFVEAVQFDNASNQNGKYVIKDNCLYEKDTGILLYGNGNSIIPSEVTEIASGAFRFCGFDNLVIPGNVKIVNYGAFSNCTFNNVTVEEGVEVLEFSQCTTKQKEFVIPGSVKKLGHLTGTYIFGLSGMEKIILSEGIESIEYYFPCEVVLPSTLKYVGERIKQGDSNITVYNGCKYFGDKNNPYRVLVEVSDDAMTELVVHKDTTIIAQKAAQGRGITKLTLQEGVQYICDGAFRGTKLTEVTIPNSVKHIGDFAFHIPYQNVNTISIVLGNGLESIGNEIFDFSGCYESCNWYGTVGYVGNDENPYLMAILFDPYKDESFTGWGEVDYILHKDTKFIATTIGYWSNLEYEGTTEQFSSNVFASEFFKNQLNEMDERKIICTDGAIDTLH